MRNLWEALFGKRARVVRADSPPPHRVVADWNNVRVVVSIPPGSAPLSDVTVDRIRFYLQEWLRGDNRVIILEGGVTIELYECRPSPKPPSPSGAYHLPPSEA